MTWKLLLAALASLALLPVAANEPEDIPEDIVVRMLSAQGVVLDIDGERRVLRVGETTPEGLKVVAASSTEVTVELNGRSRSFGLGSAPGEDVEEQSSRTDGEPAGDGEGTVRAEESGDATSPLPPDTQAAAVVRLKAEDGRYMTNGAINGRPVRFIVDTGATIVTMSGTTARALGIDYLAGNRAITRTVTGEIEVYTTTAKEVRIGEIVREDVPVAVVGGDSLAEVLLGMSFLATVDMTQREGELVLADRRDW